MSKNIQREILNKKPTSVDPVDFSTPTSLHVINRNRRDPVVEENSEEIKRSKN